MTALIGWEERTPPTVKEGDEVCFSRHVLPRDEDAVRSFTPNWEEFGKPVMFMVYGQIAGEPEIFDDSKRPTTWRVRIEVWQVKTFQPQGFGTEMQFGDWDADGRTEEGPVVEFEFKFDETLTVVRHDGASV